MEVDGGKDNDTPEDAAGDDAFKLHIYTEASPAGLYPSLRVSETWLPDPLELPSSDSANGIPWQDPPPTLISATGATAGGDSMTMEGDQRLPDLRFVAHLDPPIIVPLQMANTILPAFGLPAPQIFMAHYYFDMLLHRRIESGH